MSWSVELAKEAGRQVKKLPADREAAIIAHLGEMRIDPFRGDVKPLKGKWKGRYRKRVGRYRIIFKVDTKARIVQVSAILARTDATYNQTIAPQPIRRVGDAPPALN
jgi:mRNA-degrading endonuclease RelE of RelBE toxin-antitoxin system